MTKFAGTSFTRESDGADAFEGGGAGGTTNLSILNRNATTLDIASSSGADATVPAATTSLAGVMIATDKAKLDGIGSGANVASVAGKTGAVALAPADIVGLGEFIDDEIAGLLVAGANITLTYDDVANTLTIASTGGGGGGGGVTSVSGTGTVSGLTLSGTVTSTGNLTLGGALSVVPGNFASQTANTFLAAPNGAAGGPTFRAIVAADIPTLNQNTTGSAATLTTSRAITMTGDVSWTVNFNGSAAVSAAGTIQNGAVTYAKIQDVAANSVLARAAATSGAVGAVALSNSQLFGRGATGDLAPITLGTNLSMSGTTLNATGGGGGGLTNNWTATSAPTTSNDNTQGYAVGSQWLWAARGLQWTCLDAATGAARWELESYSGAPSGLRSQVLYTDLFEDYDTNNNFVITPPWTIQTNVVGAPAGIDGSVDAAAAGRGVRVLSTGTSATGRSGIFTRNSSFIGNSYKRLGYLLRLISVPNATENFELSFGYNSGGASVLPGSAQDLACFRYRWNGSAVEFLASTRTAAGTIQSVSLSIPTINTWFFAEVEIPATSGNVVFYINGVSVASNTTRPRNGFTQFHGISINKVAGTTAVTADVDALYFEVRELR